MGGLGVRCTRSQDGNDKAVRRSHHTSSISSLGSMQGPCLSFGRLEAFSCLYSTEIQKPSGRTWMVVKQKH